MFGNNNTDTANLLKKLFDIFMGIADAFIAFITKD